MPRMTAADLRSKYRDSDEKISMLTAYDHPCAQIADRCGVDIILVGDSVGTNVLGYESVMQVTIGDMVHHTAAVSRAVKRAFVLADLPAGTANTAESAFVAAQALIAAGADGVKLEVDSPADADVLRSLCDAGIEVCGHIGYTPQSEDLSPKAQGKTLERAMEIVTLAFACEEAKAFMLVLELVPEELAEHITLMINIPTIGIGAGRYTTGQVQVFHDIVGLSETVFKHTKHFAELGAIIQKAIVEYLRELNAKKFPVAENAAHIDSELKTAITLKTMELIAQ